jgi:hypothetical protein
MHDLDTTENKTEPKKLDPGPTYVIAKESK